MNPWQNPSCHKQTVPKDSLISPNKKRTREPWLQLHRWSHRRKKSPLELETENILPLFALYPNWRYLVETFNMGRKFHIDDYRRDCRKSPLADSWVRCRKKWPHRMHHNQRSHNCKGSWDPRKSPINYAGGFFDSLGSNMRKFVLRRLGFRTNCYPTDQRLVAKSRLFLPVITIMVNPNALKKTPLKIMRRLFQREIVINQSPFSLMVLN